MTNKPDVTWDDLDKMIHEYKSDLMQVFKLRLMLDKRIDRIMKRLTKRIERIHRIVLRKINGGKK